MQRSPIPSVLALALAALGAPGSASAQQPNPLPPIDATAIATRVVGSLHPAAGEAAVLVGDPSYYPELTRAIELELERAGVHPVLTLSFPQREIVQGLFAKPAEASRREAEWVALLQPVFARAALFFWLPARWIPPGRSLEKLVDASGVRGIHFHWLLPLEGRAPSEIETASRMYERAILRTDYAALSAEQERLVGLLRGRTLHVTTKAGTDLRLRVAADAWFHKNDGDLPPQRAARGHGARDREMEFPAGALRFIPDPASVEGKLVVPRVASSAGIVEHLSLIFEGGRAVRWSAKGNEASFRSLWDGADGDIDRIGEIVLGTSPLLVGRLPSGELPYFGYGAGYLRVSLGDNWESGGPLRTQTGDNLWLFLEGATLEADGATLVRDGALAPAR